MKDYKTNPAKKTQRNLGSYGGASGRAAVSCPDNLSLIPLGTGLFSFSINHWRFLIQVPLEGAALTDSPKNRLSCVASGEASLIDMH